jgi:hypothetical protein
VTDPRAAAKIKKKQTFWEREVAPMFNDTYYGSDESSDEHDEDAAEARRKEKKAAKKAKLKEKAEIEAKAALHVDKILKGQGCSV